MNRECEHKKVYAGFQYMTNPPQTPWICSKCGTQGTDTPSLNRTSPTYEQLVEHFSINKPDKKPDEKLGEGYLCSRHNIGYIRQCPTCSFEEREAKRDESR